MEGRFENTNEAAAEDEDDKKRKKMLEDFQKSLTKSSDPGKKGPSTYGSDRHGRD